MTDEDHDDERDPLLVRPYLLGDTGTETWPAASTREIPSHRAPEGADVPADVVPPPQPPPRPFRNRLLVLIAVCAAVLLGAAAAGLAALRSSGSSPMSETLPEAPIPALTGLVPPSPATPPSSAPASASPSSRKSASRRASPSATQSTAAPSPSGKASATVDEKQQASTAALAPGPPPTARTGTIRGQNGICLDLNGGVAADFNHVQVYDCNGSGAQDWTLATDGTLRVLGLCAFVAGDDTVHVTGCDGRTPAQWRVRDQNLVNSANGRCLTDPSAGTRSGTGVTVTGCDNNAAQQWSFP